MSQPVLNSVEYQPTCYPTVAGGPANGLTVNAFVMPNNQMCLTVRVRDVTGYIWYTSQPLAGSNNGIAVFNIPQILSNSIVYYVDVQWATLNTTPTWVAGQYATSVIVTDVPRLTELSIDSDLETIRASWDFPEYRPHLTLTYEAMPDSRTPYGGRLIFGPELFSEITENWADNIDEEPL